MWGRRGRVKAAPFREGAGQGCRGIKAGPAQGRRQASVTSPGTSGTRLVTPL